MLISVPIMVIMMETFVCVSTKKKQVLVIYYYQKNII